MASFLSDRVFCRNKLAGGAPPEKKLRINYKLTGFINQLITVLTLQNVKFLAFLSMAWGGAKKKKSRSSVATNPHVLVTAAIERNMGQLVMSQIQMTELMNIRTP